MKRWSKIPFLRRPARPSPPEPLRPEPYNPEFDVGGWFWREVAARRPTSVLEVGTLQSLPGRSTHTRDRFPDIEDCDYVRLDVEAGPDVDMVGDVHALPEEWTGRFDVFIANAVWEHLERPWVAAREVARVLAPGGIFMVATHQTFPIHGYPSDYFRFSRAGLRLLFEDAGLDVAGCDYRERCMIVPSEAVIPTVQVRAWNAEFPSYLLVEAVGQRLAAEPDRRR